MLLKRASFVPKLLASGIADGAAWLATERKHGILLNHLYLTKTRRKFSAISDKVALACRLLIALRYMVTKGLYWNDLSAHNVMLSDGEVYLFDFAEAGATELNDHISMFSWLLHDLQLEAPESYGTGIYAAINAAGKSCEQSRALMFVPAEGFFSPGLRWIYSLVADLGDVRDLKKVPHAVWKKVEELSRGRIRLPQAALRSQAALELVGFVPWSKIPYVSFAGTAVGRVFKSGIQAPSYPVERIVFELSGDSAQQRHTFDTEAAENAAALMRARRSEEHCASLIEARKRDAEVIAGERAHWTRMQASAGAHLAKVEERATRAESYAQGLEQEISKQKAAFEDACIRWSHGLDEAVRYSGALSERLKTVERHVAQLQDERAMILGQHEEECSNLKKAAQNMIAQLNGDFEAEKQRWDEDRLEMQRQVRALCDRADKAERQCQQLQRDHSRLLERHKLTVDEMNKTFETEIGKWKEEKSEMQRYTQAISERADRAESYNHHLLVEQAGLLENYETERGARERQMVEAGAYVAALTDRAERSENYARALLAEIESARTKMDMEQQDHNNAIATCRVEIEQISRELEELKEYRQRPWWQKLHE